MGLEQQGQWGLRLRLHIALEPDNSYTRVATALGIDAANLEQYMTDPDFLWDNNTYLFILDGLEYLPIVKHVRATGDNWRIIFEEKPRWTQADVELIERDEAATKVAIFIQSEGYEQNVMTVGPDDLDVFTVQQVIDDAIGAELDRLITVVWYEPIALYYFPSGE